MKKELFFCLFFSNSGLVCTRKVLDGCTDKQGKTEQIACWDLYEALILVPTRGLVSRGVLK